MLCFNLYVVDACVFMYVFALLQVFISVMLHCGSVCIPRVVAATFNAPFFYCALGINKVNWNEIEFLIQKQYGGKLSTVLHHFFQQSSLAACQSKANTEVDLSGLKIQSQNFIAVH